MNRMLVRIDKEGLVNEMEYLGADLQPIEVKSFELFKNDKSYEAWSVGSFIEFYRILKNKDKKKKRKKLVEGFKEHKKEWFSKYSYPFSDFQPDHIQVFWPHNKKRKNILEEFCVKLGLDKNSDFSSHFIKNTKKTIVKRPYEEAFSRFEFDPKGLKPIKKLLLVDDIIDSGTTCTILFHHLLKHGLIDGSTEIKTICIYSVFKRFDKQQARNERKIREVGELDASLSQPASF